MNNNNAQPLPPLAYCIPVINRILSFYEYPKASSAFQLRLVCKTWQDAIENYAPAFWSNIFGLGLNKDQTVKKDNNEQTVENAGFSFARFSNQLLKPSFATEKLERLIKKFFFRCFLPMIRKSSIQHSDENNNNQKNNDDDDGAHCELMPNSSSSSSSSSSSLWIVHAVARSGWCPSTDFVFDNVEHEPTAFDRLMTDATRSSRAANSYFGVREGSESAYYYREYSELYSTPQSIARMSAQVSILRRVVADASSCETAETLEALKILLSSPASKLRFDNKLSVWRVHSGYESVSLLNLACVLGGTEVAKILFEFLYLPNFTTRRQSSDGNDNDNDQDQIQTEEISKNNHDDNVLDVSFPFASASAFFGFDTLSQPTGISPLAMSCIYNRPEILKYLIRNIRQVVEKFYGGSGDSADGSSQHQQQKLKNRTVIARIIDTPDRAGMTPLLYAAIYNNIECFKILVEEGFAHVGQASVYPIPEAQEDNICQRMPSTHEYFFNRTVSSLPPSLLLSAPFPANSGPNRQSVTPYAPKNWEDASSAKTIYFSDSTTTTRNCGLWPRSLDSVAPHPPPLALLGSTPLIIACYVNALDVVKYLFSLVEASTTTKLEGKNLNDDDDDDNEGINNEMCVAGRAAAAVDVWKLNSRRQSAFLVSLGHWKNGNDLVRLWIDSGFLKNCGDDIRTSIVIPAFENENFLKFAEIAEMLMKSGSCRSSRPDQHWTRFIV